MGEEVDTITQSLRFSATVIFTVQAVMLVITTPALQSERILTGEHMGIALCHFELMANELGISTEFVIDEPDIPCKKEEEYIASFRFRI